MAVELATAYVSIVPSTKDLAPGITNSLVPGAESAGTTAGTAAGVGMLGGMKKFLGPAVVAGAVVGVGKGLESIGNTFDAVTDTIRIGTGATGDALDGLVDSAKNVGRNVPADFGSIAPVVADLNTRLGLSGDTLETIAGQYLEAGRILGQDIDIQATSAAFSAFGIEGAKVEGAMDALFTASQATGVGMNELAGSAQLAAPALKGLGFGFEDSIALVGQFDKAGLNSQQVMMGMTRGLVNLAKEGEQPQEAFKRVVDEIGGFIEAGDQAAALDLASEVFGTRGAPQFLDAVASGALSVSDLTEAIGASSDTILGVSGETADFGQSWQMVKNNAMLALEPLGSAVFTGLADVFASMVGPMQTIGTWLGENTWAFGVLAGIVGGILVGVFIAWAAAAWATTIALLANPITWIVLAIIGLVVALVQLVRNWDNVVAFLRNVWGGVVQWVKDIFGSIGAWFSTKGAQIGEYLRGLWTRIKTTATNLWNGLIDFIKGIPGRIIGFFSGAATMLLGVGRNIVTGMSKGFRAVWTGFSDFIRNLPRTIINYFSNAGRWLVNAGRNILRGFLDGLISGFRAVKDFVGGIGSWIASHKGPKAYDLALLTPAGGWIMEGLEKGLTKGIPGLENTLGDVANTVSSTRFGVNPGAYSAAAANPAGYPSELVIRDTDGSLIGRMRVEAGRVQAGAINPLSEGMPAWA